MELFGLFCILIIVIRSLCIDINRVKYPSKDSAYFKKR